MNAHWNQEMLMIAFLPTRFCGYPSQADTNLRNICWDSVICNGLAQDGCPEKGRGSNGIASLTASSFR